MSSVWRAMVQWWDFAGGFWGLSFVLLFGCIPLFLAGYLLTPLRMYVTGTPTPGRIEECFAQAAICPNGVCGWMYEVRVTGKPERLSIDTCHPTRSISQPVTVLYSKTADLTIAINGEPRNGKPSLFAVMTSLNRGPSIGIFFLLVSAAAVYITYRKVSSLVVFAKDSVAEAYRGIALKPRFTIANAVRVTQPITDLTFLVLLFTILGVTVYVLLRGVLFLKSSGHIWFSLLSLGFFAFTWSPAPNFIVKWVWTSYRHGGLALLRNIVGGALIVKATANVVHFSRTAELSAYPSILALSEAIGRALLGFD